jgi:exodeoxyribonuclease VII small subunit
MASFEEQLAELETVVERLERGELTLEENVGLFERGVYLSNACKCCWSRRRVGMCGWRSWLWLSRMGKMMRKSSRMMSLRRMRTRSRMEALWILK